MFRQGSYTVAFGAWLWHWIYACGIFKVRSHKIITTLGTMKFNISSKHSLYFLVQHWFSVQIYYHWYAIMKHKVNNLNGIINEIRELYYFHSAGEWLPLFAPLGWFTHGAAVIIIIDGNFFRNIYMYIHSSQCPHKACGDLC